MRLPDGSIHINAMLLTSNILDDQHPARRNHAGHPNWHEVDRYGAGPDSAVEDLLADDNARS